MRRILLLLLMMAAGCGEEVAPPYPESWVYWLQGADPDILSSLPFALVVMDYSRDGTERGEYTKREIRRITLTDKVVLAYMSIGESEDYRFYWDEGWYSDPPEWLGEENPEWEGNYAVKYWHEDWKRIVLEYLRRIVEAGFSGVYVDKVDAYEYWADSLGTAEAARRMSSLIKEIADSCRAWAGGTCIEVTQNGVDLLLYDPSLYDHVHGWSLEDVLYSSSGDLTPVRNLKERGKFVLSVEYVYRGALYDVEQYYRRAREPGLIPYAADTSRRLDSPVIIPGVQPRH